MKRFACWLLIFTLCLLCSCAELEAVVLTPTPTASAAASPTCTATSILTATPTHTAAPTRTVAATPSFTTAPTPAQTQFDTDIPDVAEPDSEPVVNAGRDLFEDSAYVYTLSSWYWGEYDEGHNGLFRISRADGSLERIAWDVSCFTLSGGSIYYATGERDDDYRIIFNTVCRYDTATGITTQVFQSGEDIYRIAVYKGRLYYAADPDPGMGREFYSDLYSRSLSGTDRRLVVEEPDAFCFYRGSIYYMSGVYGVETTPIFRCDLDGSDVQTLAEETYPYWWTFEIRSNTLFFIDNETLTMQSLGTGELIKLPGCADFALMGQYAVMLGEIFSAYDYTTGHTYSLAKLQKDWSPYNMRMYSGDGCAYFSVEGELSAFSLYRLTIENGCAVITPVAQLNAEDILG